jgi:hypothetical protein
LTWQKDGVRFLSPAEAGGGYMNNSQEQKVEEKVHEKTFHIIVNGRPKDVNTEVLSFAAIVALAFPNPTANQNTIYTVTFKHADGKRSEGTLVAGETVEIKNGTIFNVTQTNQS